MLLLSEDVDRVVTEEQRRDAVQRTGEFAMKLLEEGTLASGAPLRPITEARRVSTRNGAQRVLDGPFAESDLADDADRRQMFDYPTCPARQHVHGACTRTS
jgi:hypothetical protein